MGNYDHMSHKDGSAEVLITKCTQVEAEAKVKEYRDAGWGVLAYDDPEEAAKGYCAYRYIAKSTGLPLVDGQVDSLGTEEQCVVMQWDMFDKPLQKDVQIVSPSELAALIQTASVPVYCCDAPMRREICFVWYNLEDGVARTRRAHLTKLK